MNVLFMLLAVVIGIGAAAALAVARFEKMPSKKKKKLYTKTINEIYDYTYEVWPGAERQIQLAEGIRDLWNTMVIPSLLLAVARYAPHLLVGRPAAGDGSAADPG